MDRRQLLARLPIIGAAAVAPAAAAETFATPLDRAEHYAHKLAEAMHDLPYAMELTIHSGNRDQDVNFQVIGPGTGRIRREHLTRRLMAEAERADPQIGGWHVWNAPAEHPGEHHTARLIITGISQKAMDRAHECDAHFGGLFPIGKFKKVWAK